MKKTMVFENNIYLVLNGVEHIFNMECYNGYAIGTRAYEDDVNTPQRITITYPTIECVKKDYELCDEILYYRGLINLTHDDIHFGDITMYFANSDAVEVINDNNITNQVPLSKLDLSLETISKLNSHKVREYYITAFETDNLGYEIDKNISFLDVFLTLTLKDKGIYDLLGVGDSIIRERVFERLSELLSVDYYTIFNAWLDRE